MLLDNPNIWNNPNNLINPVPRVILISLLFNRAEAESAATAIGPVV